MWRRGFDDATRFKDTYPWEIVGAVLGGIFATLLFARLEDNEGNLERALWLTVGVIGGFVGGFLLCLGWQIVNAPRRQRNECRDRIIALEKELTDRDRIDFSLEARTEELPPHLGQPVRVSAGEITYSHSVMFWVKVKNSGPSAIFVAQIRNITGLPDPEYNEIDEVAWEHTIEPTKEIPRGGRSRLVVANYAREPKDFHGARVAPCLWFWASRSAMWAATGHQVGKRFINPGPMVDFDLEVVNSTYDQTRVAHCQIELGADPDAVPTFTLIDPPASDTGGGQT